MCFPDFSLDQAEMTSLSCVSLYLVVCIHISGVSTQEQKVGLTAVLNFGALPSPLLCLFHAPSSYSAFSDMGFGLFSGSVRWSYTVVSVTVFWRLMMLCPSSRAFTPSVDRLQ